MVRPKRTKPDSNQAEIVADLRKLGYDVDIICDLPGLYDLVVSGEKETGYVDIDNGIEEMTCSVRVEIKSPFGELNHTEVEYFSSLNHPSSYIVARCTEDILRWFE